MLRKIALQVAQRYMRRILQRGKTASSDDDKKVLPTPNDTVASVWIRDWPDHAVWEDVYSVQEDRDVQFRGHRLMVRNSKDARPATLIINVPTDDPTPYVIKTIGASEGYPEKGDTYDDVVKWIDSSPEHEVSLPPSAINAKARDSWVSDLDMNRRVMLQSRVLQGLVRIRSFSKEDWGLD